MKLLLTLGLILSLSACHTRVEERIVPVNVPVVQPCVGPLPEVVVPLKKRYTKEQWYGITNLDLKQKIAALGDWAYSLDTYSKEQEVAYKGCKSID